MIYWVVLILAILGFFLALHIWRKKSRKEKLFCIIGKDCSRVIDSKYGKTFGADNTILGMFYYLIIILIVMGILVYPLLLTMDYFQLIVLIIAGIAALFSLYLTYVQLFIIKELCEYCLVNTAIIIAIFIIMAF